MIMNKRNQAQEVVSEGIDVLTQSQNEDGFPMPPDLMSNQSKVNAKELLMSQ